MEIKYTRSSIRFIGDDFLYAVKTFNSSEPGNTWLSINLIDVNGNKLECDVFSSVDGSFY